MSYVSPGVQINEVQQTVSPNLTAPDLAAVVIAPAYIVAPMEGQGSYAYYQTFTGSGQTISMSGLGSLGLDTNSVYCDLVKTTGGTTGRIHVENTAVNPSATYGLTVAGNAFTWNAATATLFPTWSGANIRVHYRALNYALNGIYTLQAESDIDSVFGPGQGGYYENSLPFALTLALQNTTTQVQCVPIYADFIATPNVNPSGLQEASEHLRAQNLIDPTQLYGIAPYTNQKTIFAAYTSWIASSSLPINKHERIVLCGPTTQWTNSTGVTVSDSTTADKTQTAQAMRDYAVAVGDRRTFFIRPSVAYYSVSDVNIQELLPARLPYINGITDGNVFALLSSSVTTVNPDGSTTFYPALTPITNTVYAVLLNATNAYQFSVYMPMSAFYLTPEVVGMVAGQNPEQGFTNLPVAGPSMLKFSNEWFNETQLNTIAQGGNYVMINLAGSIVSRHQLSTDMNSVEERELSITKSIDFTAKFIRNILTGFIGKTLITPGFLSVVSTILAGLGKTLVKDGRINGFNVLSVTQDTVNPDTINVAINVLPKYPVNYIKVYLTF